MNNKFRLPLTALALSLGMIPAMAAAEDDAPPPPPPHIIAAALTIFPAFAPFFTAALPQVA